MIRRTVTSDTGGLDAQMNMLVNHDEVVATAGQKAYDDAAPAALSILRKEPPPAKQPIEWENDKQRIAVMIKYRKMGIEKWERGKHKPSLSEQWEITAKTLQGVFTFIVFNPSSIAKYVYGSMAKKGGGRFQQKFHKATGWFLASETGQKVIKMMNAAFRRFYRQEVIIRSRAYTRGTPRK